MIPFILTVFFTSLIAIMIILGRKVILIRNGRMQIQEVVAFEVEYFKELRNLAIKNLKKSERIALVIILRLYVRLGNFLKTKYEATKEKVRSHKMIQDKPEISKFLRIISNYKHRIKVIKHRITEEEYMEVQETK